MFPLDGVEQSRLEITRKEWMARYVYNSNAIEGSTLTLEDTELVMEGEFLPTGLAGKIHLRCPWRCGWHGLCGTIR